MHSTRDDEQSVLVLNEEIFCNLNYAWVAPILPTPLSEEESFWRISINPTQSTGLSVESVIDVMRMRSIHLSKLQNVLGHAPPEIVEEASIAIGIIAGTPTN